MYTQSVSATPLKLISSMATREVLAELALQYSRACSLPICTEAAGGVEVAKRVQADEPVDIVVLADNAINKLIADGKLLDDSRVDLAQSGIAIAVQAGAPKPAICSDDAVMQAVLAAKTLSYSTGPSGVYLEKLFERWGILQNIRNRIIVPPPGIPVGTLVATGDCELGFQQLSELMNLPGIAVLGLLPDSIQSITTFSGGITTNCRQLDAARAVLNYLAAPVTAAVKRRYGMQPA
jgi:molybdate transport system substrate-binding protein